MVDGCWLDLLGRVSKEVESWLVDEDRWEEGLSSRRSLMLALLEREEVLVLVLVLVLESGLGSSRTTIHWRRRDLSSPLDRSKSLPLATEIDPSCSPTPGHLFSTWTCPCPSPYLDPSLVLDRASSRRRLNGLNDPTSLKRCCTVFYADDEEIESLFSDG